MRSYELTLVLNPSLKDTERKKLLDTIEGFVKDAKVTKEEWGQKPLSYPIKRELAGFYVNFVMETDTFIPVDFEKKVTTADGVLRHLLTKQAPKTKTPVQAKVPSKTKTVEKEEKPKKVIKKAATKAKVKK